MGVRTLQLATGTNVAATFIALKLSTNLQTATSMAALQLCGQGSAYFFVGTMTCPSLASPWVIRVS
jgi:hypothetical protein